MLKKNNLIVALIALAVMFLVGWLLWGLIFANLYAGMVPETMAQPDMLVMVIGMLIVALCIAFVYPKGFEGGKPVQEGMRFGVVMWLLAFVGPGLTFKASLDSYGWDAWCLDQVLGLAQFLLAGIVIGVAHAKLAGGAEPAPAESAVPPPPPREEPDNS